mgnify:CR=1 FL=1
MLAMTLGSVIPIMLTSIRAAVGHRIGLAKVYLYVGLLLTQFVLSRYRVDDWMSVSRV